jgi:hypothetical protein
MYVHCLQTILNGFLTSQLEIFRQQQQQREISFICHFQFSHRDCDFVVIVIVTTQFRQNRMSN